MNKHIIEGAKKHIKGAATKAAGTVEKAYGKATGNTGAQLKGAAKKVAGSAEMSVGKLQGKLGEAQAECDADCKIKYGAGLDKVFLLPLFEQA